jgi:hypothetical protein
MPVRIHSLHITFYSTHFYNTKSNMKNTLSVIAISVMIFGSCMKDSSLPQNNGNSSNSTTITGDFVITKFTDNNPNEDKTANFSDYTFTFTVDGKIIGIKNGVSVQGMYSEKPSHEGEGAKLTINFSGAPLNELNKNWQVDLISDGAIHLSDDDIASNEVLEFTAQ